MSNLTMNCKWFFVNYLDLDREKARSDPEYRKKYKLYQKDYMEKYNKNKANKKNKKTYNKKYYKLHLLNKDKVSKILLN